MGLRLFERRRSSETRSEKAGRAIGASRFEVQLELAGEGRLIGTFRLLCHGVLTRYPDGSRFADT